MHIIEVAHAAGVIEDAPSLTDAGMNILNFLLSVAGIIAIISLVLSGIMYMLFSGDDKKMQIAKRSLTYSIIGIALAMGGMIFIKLVGQFFQ